MQICCLLSKRLGRGKEACRGHDAALRSVGRAQAGQAPVISGERVLFPSGVHLPPGVPDPAHPLFGFAVPAPVHSLWQEAGQTA